MRAITLIEQRLDDNYHFLGARLLENGDLMIEGHDIGVTAEQFFGEREYEYQVIIAAQNVPAVLLRLLKDRFTTNAFTSTTDVRQWLDEHDIPSHFNAY